MTRDVDEPDAPDAPLEPVEGRPGSAAGGIRPVRWAVLGVIAVVGGLAAFLLARGSELVGQTPPELPWTLPLVLGIAAGGVAVLAWTTHRRIHLERRWIAADRGIRLLALGRTVTLAGAFAVGFGLAFSVLFVGRMAVPVSLVRTVVGAAIAVLATGLLLAGRALERACHIPHDDPDAPSAPAGRVRGRDLR